MPDDDNKRSRGAEYIARFRARQRELGRKKRDIYLTDEEFQQVKIYMKVWREARRRNAIDGYENLTDDDI